MITEDAVISHVFPKTPLYSIDYNKSRFFFEKKCYKISKWLMNKKIQSKMFISSYLSNTVSLYRDISIYLKKDAKKITASETQRHLAIIFTPIYIKHGAFVSLWLLYMNKKPKAQSKKTSFVVKENLRLKNHYAYAGFVPSVFFIFTKKETGPKRLKADASLGSDKQLCFYSFGAFLFRQVQQILPIKRRKGAGAIFMHLTSFKYCRFSSAGIKKRNAIVYCTFAVSFWCTKKVTGPKRLRTNVSLVCCQSFFLFAFGAFLFWQSFSRQNIDGRKGAGAISMHFTSFKYCRFSSAVTKKRNAIVSCTFAVFLFGIISALFVCVILALKESKGGGDV